MPKYLVIVESPAKAKTISRYLGREYRVEASVGHVRDLPQKELGVDVERGFQPTYQVTPGKEKVIHAIREATKGAELIYLATDPDREGEAIAWHVSQAAHLDDAKLRRVAFYQVTKSAVQEALQQPRRLDADLIDAQQARRVLDRLVGYQISPLLSKAMRRALSAGRVQSVALRLVVEREREILAFVPEEYWTLEAELRRRVEAKERFRARLFKIKGQDPQLAERSHIDAILPVLERATYTVTRVQKGTRQRNPQPPFITSTMQAEASHKLRFSPRQTMRLAQQLYEGIDLEGERVGLITYMRTDSPQVAAEAQAEARCLVSERWGDAYLPDKPPQYRSKAAALAQEAHEAIRPTSVFRTPEAMAPHLDGGQARLYRLIWQRFVASQMNPAVYATMTVDITAAKDYLFRATGRSLLFPGYLVVYGGEEGGDDEEEAAQMLPPLAEGEVVDLLRLLPEQHFTQPPPRYTESTLIKALEANGVGRPSTYASILGVIQDRGYVYKEEGRLAPTALGMVVCDVLVATFVDIVDVGYTAGMEEKLDRIASGDLAYKQMLTDFYRGFSSELASAEGLMPEAIEKALWAGIPEPLRDQTCPECGKPLELRLSKAGRFMGCTGYPECRYTLDLTHPEAPGKAEKEEIFAEGELCERCGGRMKIVTHGKSRFLGCENYPKCKTTRPILSDAIKRLAAETACPECGLKPMEPKRGRYGEYLRCAQCGKSFSPRKLRAGAGSATKPESVAIACPKCGHSPLEKRTGRYGPYYRCPACKTNTSEAKMAELRGEGGGD
ncbi:MAG: type I DNA topoisomerase [Chloroflexi bacterium]|nr:type I DNA topoisomerase [Chloroflexota bacterium]